MKLSLSAGRAIKILSGLVVIISLAFVGSYAWDNYLRPSPSILDQATEHMEELVRANPNDPELRIAVADVYLANEMYRQAITQYKEVLTVTEDHKGALFGLGSAYMALGQQGEASNYYSRVVELGKDNEMARLDKQLETAYYYLGRIYLDSGDLDQAVEQLKSALTLNPADADALYLLARAYQERKDYSEAVEIYSRVITFVPDFKEAYQGLADCYQALDDPGGVAYGKGMMALISGAYPEAIQQLEAAVISRPDIANAFWGLGIAYEKTGQKEPAGTAYQQALAVDPAHILAKNGISRLERTAP
jgi:tetratricopeptide (TPR) repeat protein